MLLAVLENRFVHYDLVQLQFSPQALELGFYTSRRCTMQLNQTQPSPRHCTTATELLLSGTDDSSVTWRTSFKLQQCCHYFVFKPRIFFIELYPRRIKTLEDIGLNHIYALFYHSDYTICHKVHDSTVTLGVGRLYRIFFTKIVRKSLKDPGENVFTILRKSATATRPIFTETLANWTTFGNK
jgi:hypothetical protein